MKEETNSVPSTKEKSHKSSSPTLTQLLKDLRSSPTNPRPMPTIDRVPKTTFEEEFQKEKARKERVTNDKLKAEVDKLVAENENLRNDQSLKSDTLKKLFILLFGETFIIFIMSFTQGFNLFDFDLDLITFRVIVVATLIQVSAMLAFAVRHLFPVKSK